MGCFSVGSTESNVFWSKSASKHPKLSFSRCVQALQQRDSVLPRCLVAHDGSGSWGTMGVRICKNDVPGIQNPWMLMLMLMLLMMMMMMMMIGTSQQQRLIQSISGLLATLWLLALGILWCNLFATADGINNFGT